MHIEPWQEPTTPLKYPRPEYNNAEGLLLVTNVAKYYIVALYSTTPPATKHERTMFMEK